MKLTIGPVLFNLPKYWLYLFPCLMILLSGCNPSGKSPEQASLSAASDGIISIYTVNEPLRYMAERLVDLTWAKVVLPIPTEVTDPAYWEPNVEQVAAFQAADLILLNGANYAKWVENVSLPVSRMVDTSNGFKDRFITEEDAVTHQHGPEGEHSHAGLAFTTWLDFDLAQSHAHSIYEALKQRWPDHDAALNQNWGSLVKDLKSLDEAMKSVQQQFGDTPVLGSHPVYQYLARAYGLQLHSLHWEPDSIPDATEWQKLDAYLQESPTEWMLWEGLPNAEIQKQLETRKIKWIVFSPQGGKTTDGDFLSVMKHNIESWRQKLP